MSWLIRQISGVSSKKNNNNKHIDQYNNNKLQLNDNTISKNVKIQTTNGHTTNNINNNTNQSQYIFENNTSSNISNVYVKDNNNNNKQHTNDPEYATQHNNNNQYNNNKTKTTTLHNINNNSNNNNIETNTHTLTTPQRNIKLTKIYKLLNNNDNIDLTALRKLAWSGLPIQVRCTVWKLLLGYLPSNKQRQQNTIQRRYNEYITYKQQYCTNTTQQHNSNNISTTPTPTSTSTTTTQSDNDILHQIQIDIPRTSCNNTSNILQHTTIQQSLVDILYIWSMRHPASSYVQGMNDICIPFYIVCLCDILQYDNIKQIDNIDIDINTITNQQLLSIECDVYWLFSILLDSIVDHYTFAQPGIQRMIYKLETLIKMIDNKLYNYLTNDLNIQFIQFTFRMINCLLVRELNIQQIIRLYDTYISVELNGNGFKQYHIYICAALLLHYKQHIYQCNDFQQAIILLQNLPTDQLTDHDIESIIAQAYVYHTQYAQTIK